MLLILIGCTAIISLSMHVSFNLYPPFESQDVIPEKDRKGLIIVTVMFMIIILIYTIVNNTYAVMFQSRMNEFKLLHKLGINKSSIKSILFYEVAIMGITSSILGFFIGIFISMWLFKYDFPSAKICYQIIVWIILVMLPFYLSIVSSNFRNINSNLYNSKKSFVKTTYITKRQIQKINRKLLIGLIIGIVALLLPVVSTSNVNIFSSILFIVGFVFGFDGILYYVLKFFQLLSKKLNINFMYLASSQNLYSFKKIKFIVFSFIIAATLIVGFFGTWNSIRVSTDYAVDNNISYSHIAISENPIGLNKDDFSEYMSSEYPNSQTATALILPTVYALKRIEIVGIDRSYLEMETLFLDENSQFDDIFKGEEMNGLFHHDYFNDYFMNIRNTINYTVLETEIEIQISGEYGGLRESRQIFVSQDKLSNLMFGTVGKYNSIYFASSSEEDVKNVMEFLELKTDEYEIINVSDIKEQYRSTAAQGIKRFEILLYSNLILMLSFIAGSNGLLLSLQNRKKEYAMLRILGVRKYVLVTSMIMEATTVMILGSVFGWFCGVRFAKGYLMYLEKSLPLNYYSPTGKLMIAILGCALLLLISVVVIDSKNIKNKSFEYMYKEGE